MQAVSFGLHLAKTLPHCAGRMNGDEWIGQEKGLGHLDPLIEVVIEMV
jgi:hypothetical protein